MIEQPLYVYPEPTPVKPRSKFGTALIVTAFVVGSILLLGGLILPQVPISQGYSLSDIHNVCTGPLGQFASGLSEDARTKCTQINWLYRGGWLTAIAGAAFIASGAFAVRNRRKTATK